MNNPSKYVIIKEFFSVPGKEVTMQELKALSAEERSELAQLVLAAQAAEEGARLSGAA